MKRAAVSVDLDEIPNYLAIHGILADAVDRHAVYDIALQRLLDWADSRNVSLTLFAVGGDLERGANTAMLRRAADAGHEIANHSLSHAYDLTRRSRRDLRREVRGGADRIEAAVGVRPVGFRAPGYTTTDALYEVLAEEGVAYSSSVFPCPWYYAAKCVAIGVKRLFGKRSQSIVDTPRMLVAPREAYRVGQPYWRVARGGQGGVLELPIQTTRVLRLPFIGTSLTLAGPPGARWLTRGVLGDPIVHLELHGIDVLDASDGLEALSSVQYDVRIPSARKLACFDAAVEELRGSDYRFCTLAEVASSGSAS